LAAEAEPAAALDCAAAFSFAASALMSGITRPAGV
jgi:ascorbate-specific PTS system EIIC-type component UlaA